MKFGTLLISYMYLKGKRLFLAGSTGLVGTGIIKSILQYYPDVEIRASWHRTKPFLKDSRIEYVNGDLTSEEDCRRMASGCDCAIMAAAQTGGAKVAEESPWSQLTENVVLDARLLDAFQAESIRRIVFISTATVYQESSGALKESDLDLNKDPHPAYLGIGWAKRFSEKLCLFWHEKCGMEILIARAAYIFGPWSRFDPAFSNFIPAIIRKASDKMDPFEVWGNPYVKRDAIYSEDFARAVLFMMDNANLKFEVFNIGSGLETSVREVVGWVLKYTGHSPREIRYNSNMPATIKSRMLDISKAQRVLGWQPRFSVEQGIEETVHWWLENRKWWTR